MEKIQTGKCSLLQEENGHQRRRKAENLVRPFCGAFPLAIGPLAGCSWHGSSTKQVLCNGQAWLLVLAEHASEMSKGKLLKKAWSYLFEYTENLELQRLWEQQERKSYHYPGLGLQVCNVSWHACPPNPTVHISGPHHGAKYSPTPQVML